MAAGNCPPGYHWNSDGEYSDCVPDEAGPGGPGGTAGCPPGYEKDASGNCVVGGAGAEKPPCPEGQARNGNGDCVVLWPGTTNPSGNGCGDGKHWDESQQRCVDGAGGSGGNSGGGGTGTYKPPTYTPTKSPYDAALSKQLFDTLTDMINGGNAPFGPETIAKLQAAGLSSNKHQLANSEVAAQRAAIQAGVSRTGAAPAIQGKIRSAADADLSNNFRTIATTAVQSNYNAKVQALDQAQQFLQSERANALSQDQIILGYARIKADRDNLQAGFDQQWKIVQNGNEQELVKLMLCLRTGVC